MIFSDIKLAKATSDGLVADDAVMVNSGGRDHVALVPVCP
jgi:hypothetical protein